MNDHQSTTIVERAARHWARVLYRTGDPRAVGSHSEDDVCASGRIGWMPFVMQPHFHPHPHLID